MKKPLVLRPRADLDLARHYVFLAGYSPRKADQFRAAVHIATNRIRSNPTGGTVLTCPGLPEVELRFVRPTSFRKYLIIYQITDDRVFVLRILHGSQDIAAELRSSTY